MKILIWRLLGVKHLHLEGHFWGLSGMGFLQCVSYLERIICCRLSQVSCLLWIILGGPPGVSHPHARSPWRVCPDMPLSGSVRLLPRPPSACVCALPSTEMGLLHEVFSCVGFFLVTCPHLPCSPVACSLKPCACAGWAEQGPGSAEARRCQANEAQGSAAHNSFAGQPLASGLPGCPVPRRTAAPLTPGSLPSEGQLCSPDFIPLGLTLWASLRKHDVQQQRKSCSCGGESVSIDSCYAIALPCSLIGLSPCSSAVRKGWGFF